MAQSWQRDPGPTKPGGKDGKRTPVRNALKFMYAPHFGGTLKDMGKNSGIFVRILAHIFVQQGLFPKNHPALFNETMRLPLLTVLGIAFDSLQWNRGGVPKILFFFAVIGTIIFSVIGFFTALASMFITPAHAGIFDAPGLGDDYANSWLDYLFSISGNATGFLGPTMSIAANASTMALPNMFRDIAGFYSSAMLLVASIILIYHLISMVAATAHEGVAMGKSAHQVWAPIRLVFALGLLIPLGGGFSSGQFLVMQIAKLGSGMASNIWVTAMDKFLTGARMTATPDLNATDTIEKLMAIGYCGKNAQFIRSGSGQDVLNAADGTGPDGKLGTADDVVVPAMAGSPASGPVWEAVRADNAMIIQTGAINGAGIDGSGPNKIYKASYAADGGAWWTGTPCGSVSYKGLAPNPDTMPTSGASDYPAIAAASLAHVAAYKAIELTGIQLGAAMALATKCKDCSGKIATPIAEPTGNGTVLWEPAPGGSARLNLHYSIQSMQDAYKVAYLAAFAAGAAAAAGTAAVVTPTLDSVSLGSKLTGGTGQVSPNSASTTIEYQTTSVSNALKEDPLTRKPSGWMTAGALFVSLVAKSNAFDKAANNRPEVAVDFGGCTKFGGGGAGLGSFSAAGNGLYDCENEFTETKLKMEDQESTTNTSADGGSWSFGGMWDTLTDGGAGAIRAILRFTGLINDNNKYVWQNLFTSPYPMSDMMSLGKSLIHAGEYSLIVGFALSAFADRLGAGIAGKTDGVATAAAAKGGKYGGILSIGAKILGKSAQGALAIGAMIAPLLITWGMLILVPGMMLFYLLPMLPFIHFCLGVLTWLVTLLQAVIAIPVIAIAHITPHGEGLPSGSARGAYTMMLQLFLRPIMMIVGLVVTALLINTGITFLTRVFFIPLQTGLVGSDDPMSSIVFFLLYASTCYALINASIQCIDEFPMRSVSWIGGSTVDHDFSRHGASTAATIMGGQALGQVSQGLQGSIGRISGGNSVMNAQNAAAARAGGNPMMDKLAGGAESAVSGITKGAESKGGGLLGGGLKALALGVGGAAAYGSAKKVGGEMSNNGSLPGMPGSNAMTKDGSSMSALGATPAALAAYKAQGGGAGPGTIHGMGSPGVMLGMTPGSDNSPTQAGMGRTLTGQAVNLKDIAGAGGYGMKDIPAGYQAQAQKTFDSVNAGDAKTAASNIGKNPGGGGSGAPTTFRAGRQQ